MAFAISPGFQVALRKIPMEPTARDYFANRVFDSLDAATRQAEQGLSEMAASKTALRSLLAQGCGEARTVSITLSISHEIPTTYVADGRRSRAFFETDKTRVRPVLDPGSPAMLNRVPMDIRGMSFKIVFIPDEMFPIAPVPNTSPPLAIRLFDLLSIGGKDASSAHRLLDRCGSCLTETV